MIRGRRRPREIPFSFDSFLDVVANVVGIIIRLILVAWVGARSYSSVQEILKQAEARRASAVGQASRLSPQTGGTPVLAKEPADPLEQELIKHRQELAKVQARLLEQLRQLQDVREKRQRTDNVMVSLVSRRQGLEAQLRGQRSEGSDHKSEGAVALSLAEIQKRRQRLAEEIQALEKLPPLGHILHYRTPVSRPVYAEELMFECRQGRVTFLDIGSLLADIRKGTQEKANLLRSQWQVSDVTRPTGAFRLRYILERERSTIDSLGSGLTPATDSNFRYAMTEWQAEPLTPVRGETAQEALSAQSEFRQIVDVLDPQQTVVTFWIYADSFALFRQLRDYLYDRDVVVAGRPLPDNVPIMSSRHGTLSRGQ
jgi:hypothetical protein